MQRILSLEANNLISRYLYNYRFLLSYILIGLLSIIIEIGIYRSAKGLVSEDLSLILAVSTSILFAFILNIKFNFKVPKPKRNKSFFYFSLISVMAFVINYQFYQLISQSTPYEISRLISSGSLFLLGYVLHRRFSFKEYKKVGVAVYADGNENIKEIYEKIQYVGDFIHIDIVDKSFNKDSPDPATYRLETVRAYWPNKEIHCHIMSKTPLIWIEQVKDYVDTIIIHFDIAENLESVISMIKNSGKKVGICLAVADDLMLVDPYLPSIDEVMLLTIPRPGRSGQKFHFDSLKKIKKLNDHPLRSNFILSVDGGINDSIIHLVQAEKVISGSYVLCADNPQRNIMRLQTSSQYEALS